MSDIRSCPQENNISLVIVFGHLLKKFEIIVPTSGSGNRELNAFSKST
jgi:hypothetical protein